MSFESETKKAVEEFNHDFEKLELQNTTKLKQMLEKFEKY